MDEIRMPAELGQGASLCGGLARRERASTGRAWLLPPVRPGSGHRLPIERDSLEHRTMTQLRDLLDLPESIQKSQFVVNLKKGVGRSLLSG
jgi:hypothetical protein